MEIPDYALPREAIAQTPSERRDQARLLVSLGEGEAAHRHVSDLPTLLRPGDALIINTTRVLPARLILHKLTGGAAEVLLLEPEPVLEPELQLEPGVPRDGQQGAGRTWEALVRPGRRLPPGTLLYAAGRPLVEVGARLGGGRRRVRLLDTDEVVLAAGRLPLPPYIDAAPGDPERYQTVYADRPGSVAAPTAGLHLTTEVLDRCRARGVQIGTVDLAVGLGTFAPISAERAEDHVMHQERYSVPDATMELCAQARRVVAVGTTTVRALESAATGVRSGRSGLYIRGDYPWRVVDVLMTNFHQPRSTLLLLLEAFVGPRWRELYAMALDEGYRFLSFGDAMLVARRGGERSPV